MAQDGLKMASTWPRNCITMASTWPQRRLKMAPRSLQDGPISAPKITSMIQYYFVLHTRTRTPIAVLDWQIRRSGTHPGLRYPACCVGYRCSADSFRLNFIVLLYGRVDVDCCSSSPNTAGSKDRYPVTTRSLCSSNDAFRAYRADAQYSCRTLWTPRCLDYGCVAFEAVALALEVVLLRLLHNSLCRDVESLSNLWGNRAHQSPPGRPLSVRTILDLVLASSQGWAEKCAR